MKTITSKDNLKEQKTITKEYVMVRKDDHIFSYLLDKQKAVEIHCDSTNLDSLLGNVYIGRIQKVAVNMGAAFIEIAPSVICHAQLSELDGAIYTKKGSSAKPQQGDELVVQVIREGIKTKLPSVSANINLQGHYVVLTSARHEINVSRKLSRSMREWLKAAALANVDSLREQYQTDIPGFILRTNAQEADEETIETEMRQLFQQFHAMTERARFLSVFSSLFYAPPAYLKRIQNLYHYEVDKIITDDFQIYEELKQLLAGMHFTPQLSCYQDHLIALDKLYNLDREMKEATSKIVWLKSGGNLVIEPTEALTVIDVNTGKAEAKKDKEAFYAKINKEASVEIARQLRLRNLSGIIIIDFINMESNEAKQQLIANLQELLAKDPVSATVVDMTQLGLIEITRKKIEKTLQASLSEIREPLL